VSASQRRWHAWPARCRQQRGDKRRPTAQFSRRWLCCSPACRTETYRLAHPAAHEPLLAAVDHGSIRSRGRPAGHVWLVRLRGQQQTVIAVGLGRPSADHLASQMRDVITPPPLATPLRIR